MNPSALSPEFVRWEDERSRSLDAMTQEERAEYEAASYEADVAIMLSELVYDLRLEAGLTRTQLAGLAGTDEVTLSAIETGRQIPSVPILMRLSSSVGKTLAIEAK